MNIKIHVDNMRDAERLSYLCNHYPYELYLRAGKFCADPKSTLGVLAMMYADRPTCCWTPATCPTRSSVSFPGPLPTS